MRRRLNMEWNKYSRKRNLELRRKYENGEISAEEFLDKLFSSREADRRRRNIVKKNEKSTKRLQEV